MLMAKAKDHKTPILFFFAKVIQDFFLYVMAMVITDKLPEISYILFFYNK